MTRTRQKHALMERIVARDEGRCHWCGREIGDYERTRDHIIPKSRGGPATLENLILSCRSCNEDRGDMSFEAYAAYLDG